MNKLRSINFIFFAILFLVLSGCDGTLPTNYPSPDHRFVASPCPDLSGRYLAPINPVMKFPVLVLPVSDGSVRKKMETITQSKNVSITRVWDKSYFEISKINDYKYVVRLYFDSGDLVAEYQSTISTDAVCHEHVYHWGGSNGMVGHSVEGATSHYEDFSEKIYLTDRGDLIEANLSRSRQVGFGVIVGPIVEDEKRTVYKRLNR
ncbi:hypothetical protein SAMN04515617_13614 [Collimonas sp. OK242]|nr:hypothetical protein SAMN04515617_13614 [Collimonas sp. OK242]